MLNSVQHLVRGILDGLASPLAPVTKAFIQPPQLADAAGNPLIYVWGGKIAVTRQTAPRPVAWQNFNWDVSLAVTQAYALDSPDLDSAFPLVLDQIMATLGTTKCPLVITDPVTGAQTQVVAIGERYDGEYNVVMTTGTAGEGLWVYAADLLVRVEEKVNFNVGTYYNQLGSA